MFGRDLSHDEISRDVTIVSQKHCWRTLGGTETRNYASARQAIDDGCHIQDLTFVLRHPEAMLCDLSNLEWPVCTYDAPAIEAVFDEIDLVTRSIPDSESVKRISGEDLRPEIAVSAPTSAIAEEYKDRLLEKLISTRKPSPVDRFDKRRARGIGKSRHIIDASPRTQEIYNSFCAYYGRYVASTYWATSKALNQSKIYDDHVVWGQIEKLGDNKLFIVSAGLALGLGFSESTGDDRLFFNEVHRQNDPSILEQRATFDEIYPDPAESSGSWVVIDKAYTGGSIRRAKGCLRNNLKRDVKITTVALFPKSLEAVAAADYVVYAGRLIEVKSVIRQLTYTDWHRQLLLAGDN